MKEELKRPVIYGIIIVALIFVISFSIGFFLEKPEPENVQTHISANTPSPAPVYTPEPIEYYRINLNASKLEMYKIKGEDVIEIREEEVAEDIFPADDIEMLKQGVQTENYETALSIWENFIS